MAYKALQNLRVMPGPVSSYRLHAHKGKQEEHTRSEAKGPSKGLNHDNRERSRGGPADLVSHPCFATNSKDLGLLIACSNHPFLFVQRAGSYNLTSSFQLGNSTIDNQGANSINKGG